MMAVQTARLATTAIAPIPIRHPSSTFFELPYKKRRQRRLREEEERQKALLEAEEESRSLAWNYIVDFLHASEWCSQMGQITVVYEAVPTMEELESYGYLDEKEGTRASRKLFKAPVVWDELGHGLWKLLNAAALERRREDMQRRQAPAVEEPARSVSVCWNSSLAGYTHAAAHSICSSRRSSSRRTSEDSCSTAVSQESSTSPRVSLSSSPSRHGSIPRIFSRMTSRRSNSS